MVHLLRLLRSSAFAALICLFLSVPIFASAVVTYLDEYGSPRGVTVEGVSGPLEALSALSAPPVGLPYSSAIPVGTRVLSLEIDGNTTVVNFSKEIIAGGLEDLRLENIFHQVRNTLYQFGFPESIRLISEGTPLYQFLKPINPVSPRPQTAGTVSAQGVSIQAVGTALSGKKVSLSPGHGLFWTGSGWGNERGIYCAPLDREDYDNIELARFLDVYLKQDGATVKNYRCIDKNYGNYATGEPWWHMSGSYWLQNTGYPCSVYASSTGDCTLGAGTSESSDNIRSRPLAADYDNTDAHIAIHTNGLAGDCYGSSCPNGTCTYYDTSTTHAPWTTVSQSLAQAIDTAVVDAIRTRYGDTTWRDRGALGSDGDFAETRVPQRASTLIELAFHDSCDRDGLYLRDNFFRSTCMWATYKGVCAYFGVTPTWDYYSYEVVSSDLPATMITGTTRTVHITLKNHGVLWSEARQFRLGAVGDSDPFTTATRQTISGEIWPDQTVTFTFNLVAPTTPGTYRTDWRMLREGTTWFGATIQRDIQVVSSSGDTQAPTVPGNLRSTYISQTQVNLAWTASTDNYAVAGYKIYRNGTYLTSVSTNTYSDTGLSTYTAYSYQVSAFDDADNESAKSNTVNVTTLPTYEYIIDNTDADYSGTWTAGSTASNKYGSDYRYATTAASETRTATWTPNLQAAGYYDVYVWYPEGSNRSAAAPYTVVYRGGSVTVPVNQQANGGKWNKIASSKPFGPGTAGYVVLGNGTGESSLSVMADAVRLYYVASLDITPPTIKSVTLRPALAGKRDSVSVTIDVTDNISVSSVKANGVTMFRGSGSLWNGTIPTDDAFGTHMVSVVATDPSTNSSTNTTASYITAPVYGLSNRALLLDSLVQTTKGQYVFETWGRVNVTSTGTFDITDGSGQSISVNCPSHGLVTGNFVSAHGIWNSSSYPNMLDCTAGQVRKY